MAHRQRLSLSKEATMRRSHSLVGTLLICVATGCVPPGDPAGDPAADEAAIRAVDSQMVAALHARDLDRWLGFLAEDARMMPPDAPVVEGKTAIRELIAGLLSLPEFSVTHHPGAITVGRGGDLAYISYAYELTVPDAQGGSITETGKDISVFRKQTDGSWKLVVDMWSPNEPAPQL